MKPKTIHKEGEGRIIEISKELKKDRGFQYTVLKTLIEIDEEYARDPRFSLGGLFPEKTVNGGHKTK